MRQVNSQLIIRNHILTYGLSFLSIESLGAETSTANQTTKWKPPKSQRIIRSPPEILIQKCTQNPTHYIILASYTSCSKLIITTNTPLAQRSNWRNPIRRRRKLQSRRAREQNTRYPLSLFFPSTKRKPLRPTRNAHPPPHLRRLRHDNRFYPRYLPLHSGYLHLMAFKGPQRNVLRHYEHH